MHEIPGQMEYIETIKQRVLHLLRNSIFLQTEEKDANVRYSIHLIVLTHYFHRAGSYQ